MSTFRPGLEFLAQLPAGATGISLMVYGGKVLVATDQGSFALVDGKLEPIEPCVKNVANPLQDP